jgi:hypothetical protein
MKDVIDTYLEATNHHNIDDALDLLADDFTLDFEGTEFSIRKQDMPDVLGWDKGVNGHVEFDDLRLEGDSVKGQFTERNEFLELLGIKELKSENTFIVDESGRISKQLYKANPGQPSFIEKLQPAIQWARQHRPDVLDRIYPDNQMQYNEEMGTRWVQLLREWRRQTNET